MREKISLNKSWLFHLGELARPPKKMAKKAYAFGGLTSSLPEEKQARLQVSPGGTHFLKLIAQGDTEIGLRNLCGTDLESHLDDSWTQVDLPHDWKVTLPYEDNPINLMAGSKPDGVAYYRKRFAVTENARLNKRVILHFEGVSRFVDIWLNGAYLGHNNSGYNSFSFDVSEMLYYGDEGENVLLVKADTTVGSEGWWYEGAGIYKNVYLEIKPDIYLNEDDFYIYTKSLGKDSAKLGVELSVTNDSSKSVKIAPQVSLSDRVITFDEQVIAPLATVAFSSELTLENPKIWSPKHPNLYHTRAEISGDNLSKTFGIRTFAYDQSGFYLNGMPYELHGVCEHQDFAGVGVALSKDIIDYKIKVMKEMGVNAYRSAHHFASKELLEACDKYGILVMNENRLPEASPWRLADLEKMVKKARTHASLAFWSISNEELIGNTVFGSRNAKRFAQLIKSLDYEHLLVSAELLSPEGYVDEEYLKYFDILGVNYPEAAVMGAGAEIIHQNHPDLPMMSTENASYFSTRGIYRDNADACQCNNFGSMYSMVLPGKRQPGDPGVGGTAHPEEVMQYLNEHPYMGGVFLWTAFDYFGEPSPFAYPGIGSQFGICDVNGFPKDYYYYYKAYWTDAPMVHVMPHWNQEGLEIDELGKTLVRVFSNADSVEVFINGVSQGKKEIVDCQANYDVLYQAGELKVLAYKGDKVVAQDRKQTSGKVNDVLATKLYSGDDLVLFEITALDENGCAVPTACDDILVTSEKGTVIGLGNGNPADISEYSLSEITLFSGKALAIVFKDENNEAKISVSFKSVK